MSELLGTRSEPLDARASLVPPGPVRVEVDRPPTQADRAPGPDAGFARHAARRARVRALIPCHNRADDLTRLLSDLSCSVPAIPGAPVSLEVIIIDNASDPPLPCPPMGAAIRVIRSDTNLGGSGGFNLAMQAALKDWPRDDAATDLLWLLDSDARVLPGTLVRLIDALSSDPSIAAVGPALADPRTRIVHEVGGIIDPDTGCQRPGRTGNDGMSGVEACDYVASCCLLVRREVVERVGLMPDRFINADDAEWCLRIADATGMKIAAEPAAIALHPRFDRFPTWQRYFGTRNAFGPIDAKRLPRRVRFRHAMSCVAKAINQTLMGRDDLAELHILGLRDASRGVTTGPATHDVPRPAMPASPNEIRSLIDGLPGGAAVGIDPAATTLAEPDDRLAGLLTSVESRPGATILNGRSRRDGLAGACSRWLLGPALDLAIVPASGAVRHWLAADTLLCVSESGSWITRPTRSAARRAVGVFVRGMALAARVSIRPREDEPLPPAPVTPRASTPTLSIVVLSFNRADSLAKTLTRLREEPMTRDAEVIVVDNASTDGSPRMVRETFPHCRLIELDENIAIAGFNRGVEAATGGVVLVLDDDSWPDRGVVERAMNLLSARPDLAAVALLPVHPETRRPEWRFADADASPRADWPTMGCANLVRRADWLAVGGYDESFFLYRNDTDMALKLLSIGRGVWFDPSWIAWHESPAAAAKSARWFRMATRNWIWMCRRHGRGATRLGAALAGWLWAHKLAGFSPASQWAVWRGLIAGAFSSPPPCPAQGEGGNMGLRRLLQLQRRSRRRARP